jgi:uncharacterized membrane protein
LKTVKIDVIPQKVASRLELLVRIPYAIILGIILYFLGLIVFVLFILNIVTILLVKQRVAVEFIAAYIEQYAKVSAYLTLVTDERPPLLPEFK